jgi:uncharacterized membrane-anchored protein YhcB (DUF1043 family)
MVKYGKRRRGGAMVLAAGIVGFILGVNVGFLFAGLMRAAREEQKQTREEQEQTKDENGTCGG